MSLLDGKRILVTGVLTDASLAFGVARHAQEQGAEVILTGAGRGLSLTQRTARKLPVEAAVLELDVTDPSHVAAVRDELGIAPGAEVTTEANPDSVTPEGLQRLAAAGFTRAA